MKHDAVSGFMGISVNDLMIPESKVAFVSVHHSLEHALLILTQSGYTAVPVLDQKSGVVGIVTTTHVIKAILGVHGYDVDKLATSTVESVMSQDVPKMQSAHSLLRAFELSINHPFICVENEEGLFVGILTRRTVLAKLYQNVRSQE